MFLASYRFTGEPAALLAAHSRLIALVPAEQLHLHACAPHPAGLDVYDGCPTREAFERFSTSAEFRELLSQAGLPAPIVQPIGEISRLLVGGKQII